MSGGTGVPSNPWIYQAIDYAGNALTISITWNASNSNITGGTVTRDPACLYQNIYWGAGTDGTPNSSTATMHTIPSGTTNASAAQIKSNTGFSTITQLAALQITAGP